MSTFTTEIITMKRVFRNPEEPSQKYGYGETPTHAEVYVPRRFITDTLKPGDSFLATIEERIDNRPGRGRPKPEYVVRFIGTRDRTPHGSKKLRSNRVKQMQPIRPINRDNIVERTPGVRPGSN